MMIAMAPFYTCCLSLLLCISTTTFAQQYTAGDTVLSESPTPSAREDRGKKNRKKIRTLEETQARFNPTKAFFYSTILPGAGQVYNKKYWKVPIVLGGLAGGALLINFHQTRYYTLKKELYALLRDSDYTPPSGLTESQLRGGIDRSKRDRDLFTVLTVLWYFLQAVEAHVDAHLIFFKINPRLQVRVAPLLQHNLVAVKAPGLALTLRF